MSYPILTPQRPLPGAYVPTPAASKYGAGPVTRQLFPRPVSTVPLQQSTPSTMIAPAQSAGEVTNPATQDTLTPVQRAAKTINDTLTQELRYPELDSYIGRE
jgi:nuclear pore complex protein Nup155